MLRLESVTLGGGRMCWDQVIDAEEPAKENRQAKKSSEQESSLEPLLKQLLVVRAEASSQAR